MGTCTGPAAITDTQRIQAANAPRGAHITARLVAVRADTTSAERPSMRSRGSLFRALAAACAATDFAQ